MRPLARVFALAPDCHAANNRYADLWRRHFYQGLAGALPEVVLPADVDFSWARPASEATLAASPERTALAALGCRVTVRGEGWRREPVGASDVFRQPDSALLELVDDSSQSSNCKARSGFERKGFFRRTIVTKVSNEARVIWPLPLKA